MASNGAVTGRPKRSWNMERHAPRSFTRSTISSDDARAHQNDGTEARAYGRKRRFRILGPQGGTLPSAAGPNLGRRHQKVMEAPYPHGGGMMPPPPPPFSHGGGTPGLAGPPQTGGMPPYGGPPPEHQALPPPPPMQPPPLPPPPPAPTAPEQQQQQQQPGPTSKKLSLGGGSVRLQLNRDYYRTPPGVMGIVEVLCSCAIVAALSLRGFIFDVFFFLCNLGFTYALVGVMFFVNGLLGSRAGRDLPLLVAVQYYGLGFIMFLAAGIAGLVKSQRDILAILVGTLAVVVAITLFVHAVYSVRTS